MEIRRAVETDLPALMDIYEEARQFMRAHGNQEQWSGGYPQKEILLADIAAGCLYVCEEDQKIGAVFFYRVGEDPTYRVMEQGSWPDHEPYAVIHRITSRVKGGATFCLKWCEAQGHNLRIDTHRDNYVMQNFLTKNGFTYCGIIHLADGAERLAYAKSVVS